VELVLCGSYARGNWSGLSSEKGTPEIVLKDGDLGKKKRRTDWLEIKHGRNLEAPREKTLLRRVGSETKKKAGFFSLSWCRR